MVLFCFNLKLIYFASSENMLKKLVCCEQKSILKSSYKMEIFFAFPENHLSIILWVSLQKLKSWQIVESSIEKLSSGGRTFDKLWNLSIHQIDLSTSMKQQTIRRLVMVDLISCLQWTDTYNRDTCKRVKQLFRLFQNAALRLHLGELKMIDWRSWIVSL